MTREDIDRIATEYLNDTESTFEMQDIIELADKALILEEKINEYEQLLKSKDLSIQCFQASADMFRERNEKYESAIEDIKAEIKGYDNEYYKLDEYGKCIGLSLSLEIIDNHLEKKGLK